MLGLGLVLTTPGLGDVQPTMADVGAEGETVTLPRRAAALTPDQDVEGTLTARTPAVWYRLNVPQAEDIRSLRVTLTLPEDASFDADLALFDPEGRELAASSGVCPQEQCLTPVEGLPRVFVRVELYEPDESEAQACPFALRAELSPRAVIAGLPIYADACLPLQPGHPASGRLPSEDEDSPTVRWYVVELPETVANVARFELTADDSRKAVLGFGICRPGGEVLGEASEGTERQSLRASLEGVSGPVYVAVWLASRQPGEGTDYALSVELAQEEPGPVVLARIAATQPKAFLSGQRVLGQIVDPAQPFRGWLLNTDYAPPQLLVCPDRPGGRLRVTVRDEGGWVVREQEVSGERLAPIRLSEDRLQLIEVAADQPCGFGMAAVATRAAPTFDPTNAQPLPSAGPVAGRLEGGGMAVYRMEAPLAATVPRVQLAADPPYADLDLYICAEPGVLISASTTPGGSEAATVLPAGAAPCYVVVTAAPGAPAAFSLTVEDVPAALAPSAVAGYSDYLRDYFTRALPDETEAAEDPLADQLGPPDPFGGG
ncbi:MAG: hypothetical protein FJX74_03945 [Armatimonadetes bacterium]|nr:hypothetical protein [Armatimonadota bacterium]